MQDFTAAKLVMTITKQLVCSPHHNKFQNTFANGVLHKEVYEKMSKYLYSNSTRAKNMLCVHNRNYRIKKVVRTWHNLMHTEFRSLDKIELRRLQCIFVMDNTIVVC